MSKMGEKVAYLKGLAEGLSLDTETKEGKLLSAQALEPVYLRPPHADLPNRA